MDQEELTARSLRSLDKGDIPRGGPLPRGRVPLGYSRCEARLGLVACNGLQATNRVPLGPACRVSASQRAVPELPTINRRQIFHVHR